MADKRKGSLAGGLLRLVALLWVGVTVTYHLGAGTDSFERSFDRAMFRVDDRVAFTVNHNESMDLIEYEGGMPPFRPLCGSYWLDAYVMTSVDYRAGDWVYSGYPQHTKVDAYNLVTGERISVDVQPPEGEHIVDPATIPEYVEHGLTFDEVNRLDLGDLLRDFEEVSAINDSCLTFNAAFIFMLLVLGAAWGAGFLFGRLRRR